MGRGFLKPLFCGTSGSLLILPAILLLWCANPAIAYLNGTANEFPHEYRLIHKDLLKNYDETVRPRYDSNTSVTVNVRFSLQQIYDLDEKRQILTISGWLTAEWYDEFLVWNPASYGGLESFVITPQKIWTPLLAIGNSATKMFHNWRHFWVTVRSDGRCRWQPGGNFAFTCRLDMNYYPFDSQKCTMEVETWFYSDDKVKLNNTMTEFGLETYLQNGEWEVYKTEVQKESRNYQYISGEQFPELLFRIFLKRKYTFHFMYIMLPCIMLSFVLLMVYQLPAESGEKINLGVSILVAFSVFLLIVADKVPDTSDAVPVMAMYLMYFMLTTALSVVFSTFVLKLHYQGHEERAPRWLRIVTFDLLAPLLCLRSITRWHQEHRRRLSMKPDAQKSNGEVVSPTSTSAAPVVNDIRTSCNENDDDGNSPCCNHIAEDHEALNNRADPAAAGNSRLSLNITRTLSLELAPGEESSFYRSPGCDAEAINKDPYARRRKLDPISEEWKKISEVVDRLLFWTFLFFLILPLVSLIAFVRSPKSSY